MSDSVQPHRQQPTRLPPPWDSPGKNTGEDCHILLQCMKVKSESEVAQLCPTFSYPMDCSPPGSSVHGIFQARVLEWGAIAFSEDWSLPPSKNPPLPSTFLFEPVWMGFCCFYSQKNPVLDGYQKGEHSVNHQTKIKAPMGDNIIIAKLAQICNAVIQKPL